MFRDIYRFGKNVLVRIGQDIGLTDHVPAPRGRVRCWVDEIDGVSFEAFNRFLSHDEVNIIVTRARKAMTHLVAAGDANYQITGFQAGTGGHVPGDPLTPIDPLVTDTALDVSTFTKAITLPPVYAPVVEESNVTLTLVMETSEGNGGGTVQYTEAGLFSDNGNLFARQTFPAVVKTNTRRITFDWTLYF